MAYHGLNAVEMTDPETGKKFFRVLKRNGEIAINDDKGREFERYKVPYGSAVSFADGAEVPARQMLVQWDTHFTPILAEAGRFRAFAGRGRRRNRPG